MDASITAPAPRPATRLRLVLLASAAATAALYALPAAEVVAWPLHMLATLVHEMGHGVVGLLTGGSFERLQIWPNGSGAATVASGLGRLGEAAMAAGGLVGPAVAAAIGFVAGRTPTGARAFLLALGSLLVVAEVLVIRGLFSLVFAGALAALCLAIGLRSSPQRAQWIVIFLSVQLALSVFSDGGYLFVEQATIPEGIYVSDVGRIAQILFLPYWFWGLVCGAFSVAVLVSGLRIYWGR